jgi:hypothetical protein
MTNDGAPDFDRRQTRSCRACGGCGGFATGVGGLDPYEQGVDRCEACDGAGEFEITDEEREAEMERDAPADEQEAA